MKLLAAILVAATLIGGSFFGWVRYRTASSQEPAYQRFVAALGAGLTVHVADAVYQPSAAPPAERPRHALPDTYTSDLWLQYAGENVAVQCALVRNEQGTFVQASRYDNATGELVTTYADGTSFRHKYSTYTLSQVMENIATTPGIKINPSAAARGTAIAVDASNGSSKRVNYYDDATGEFIGADEFPEAIRAEATPAVRYSLRRKMEILPERSSALDECLRAGSN